jgi:hypothetical protein
MSADGPLDGVSLGHLTSGGSDGSEPPQGTPPAGESSGAPAPEPQSVPYDRFNEVVRERTRISGRVQELERQIAALTGVQRQAPPEEPEDPSLTAVRTDLLRVMPQLKELERLAKIADQLEQMAQTVPAMQGDQQAYWDGVADRTVADVWTQAAQKLGVETLSEPLKGMIYREFLTHVQGNPEASRRYQSQDRTLVSEFVDQLAQHLAPARRTTAATVETRRAAAARTPQGGTSSPVVGSAPPAKPKGEDDLMNAAFAGFQSFLNGGR